MLVYIAIVLTLILLVIVRMNYIVTLNQKNGFEALIEAINAKKETK